MPRQYSPELRRRALRLLETSMEAPDRAISRANPVVLECNS